MRLFLYGTLLRPAVLARFAGRPVATRPAALRGWRRTHLGGTGYPTLRRAPGQVEGAVMDADAATLRRLMAYEGVRYRLERVTVRTARGPELAHVWIAAAALTRPWP
jgi:gamma-glutamylcyclotransferase (GGCT)/AIG2-like uncharacterized protein YtfP